MSVLFVGARFAQHLGAGLDAHADLADGAIGGGQQKIRSRLLQRRPAENIRQKVWEDGVYPPIGL